MAEKQAWQSKKCQRTRHLGWLRVLLIGLLLYVVGIVALVLTGNPNLFPTVVMLGNFLVPVAFVAYFYERRELSRLSMPTTALAFLYGGLLGVLAASILEPIVIHRRSLGAAFLVGLIEEFVKILGVLVIARRRRHNAEMDGLILGAAAGMGFAALESIGYAFTAFLTSRGSLSATVAITLLRGVLSPVGHGVWTAILISVLFRESGPKHFRINLKVISAYLLVSVLHGLWDLLPSVISAFVSSGIDVFIGQAVVGGIGLFVLWRRWREARRLQEAEQAIGEASAAEGIEPAAEAGQGAA
jgi:RsiW-degrading membrane proteinase PrsW (M82 family)